MDKERADYKTVVENVKDNLNANIIPLQLPVGKESSFSGVVDLLNMKSYLSDSHLSDSHLSDSHLSDSHLSEDSGKGVKEQEVPDSLKSEAEERRMEIIEAAAESTDKLTEKYLEGESLTEEEIEQGLKKRIAEREVVPMLFGSSLMCKGIREAIHFIIKVAPRSNYREKIKALDIKDLSKKVELVQSTDSDFTGIVFKTLMDQFTGKITFLRVIAGVLKSDEDVYNRTKDRKERLSKLSRPFGKNQLPFTRDSEEGDIVVFTKLPYAETGDTLTSLSKEVILPKLSLPQPVHSVAIRAKNKKEEDKLSSLLGRAAEEDISFNVVFNSETKQTVISGMGELQIGIILSHIKDKNGIEFETSTPLVAYRETIGAPAKADYKHKKQTGGHGQYGQVFLEIEPLSRGEGFEFVDKIVGGVIPKGYIPGVEKGVKEALGEGVVAGYPVVDVKVFLVFGSFHDVDSSELAFKIAGRQAFKLAMEQGKPTLLEPIMDLNVYVEEKYTGDIMSDLNGKRGKVLGMDNIGVGIQLIKAKVPQAELLKYSIELRSITSGTGSFEMDFSHYEPISGKIAADVIKETQSRKEALEKEK
jgi:elongation factor G